MLPLKTYINITFFHKRKYNYRYSISYVLQKYDQTNNIIYEINFEIIFVWSLGKNGLVMIDDQQLFQALEAILLYWKNGKCSY